MNQLPNLGTGKKPSKKLFAILATAFLAVLGVVGYISLAGDTNDAPPYLEMDTSSLMQGKLSKLKGFAELKTSDKYSCVEGKEVILAKGINYIFSTQPMTFVDIANSLKFDKKDGQYLIAFFSPGDDRAGKGFDKEGWYFYPTSHAPYKTMNDKGVGYSRFDIENGDGIEYVVPPYRGFVITVNNSETKICGDSLKLATDKEVFAKLADGDVFMKLLYEDMKYWPKGWIMMPFGIDVAAALKDGNYDSALGFDFSHVFMQTDRATFEKEFTAEDKNDYLMFWVKMNKAFDWEKFWNDLKEVEDAEEEEDIDDPTDGYGDNDNGDEDEDESGYGYNEGDELSTDTDGDGVVDDSDNCSTVANSDQADSDNDGIGDVCEEEEEEEDVVLKISGISYENGVVKIVFNEDLIGLKVDVASISLDYYIVDEAGGDDVYESTNILDDFELNVTDSIVTILDSYKLKVGGNYIVSIPDEFCASTNCIFEDSGSVFTMPNVLVEGAVYDSSKNQIKISLDRIVYASAGMGIKVYKSEEINEENLVDLGTPLSLSLEGGTDVYSGNIVVVDISTNLVPGDYIVEIDGLTDITGQKDVIDPSHKSTQFVVPIIKTVPTDPFDSDPQLPPTRR